jgi:hypothetical protein
MERIIAGLLLKWESEFRDRSSVTITMRWLDADMKNTRVAGHERFLLLDAR